MIVNGAGKQSGAKRLEIVDSLYLGDKTETPSNSLFLKHLDISNIATVKLDIYEMVIIISR